MAEREQNYKNHGRTFPLFHFFVLPVLAANFLNAARHVWLTPDLRTAFTMLVAFALIAFALATRVMALTVQDRVIRLEMQLRLQRVLPPELHARIGSLGRAQLVALRFAGDDELPALVRDVTDGRLQAAKEIKLRVKNWQADWLRA